VGVTAPGFQMVCVPDHVRKAPKTIVEAQFSIPYATAAAWVDGGVELRHFTQESVTRPDLHALAGKVEPYVHEEIQRDWHRYVTPSAVTVTFTDGEVVETRVDDAKGHPRNPMTADEFARKTEDCAAHTARPLDPGAAKQLADAVARLAEQPDVAELLAVLRPR
jgi:2-methylcitrate dehydratase PrpD